MGVAGRQRLPDESLDLLRPAGGMVATRHSWNPFLGMTRRLGAKVACPQLVEVRLRDVERLAGLLTVHDACAELLKHMEDMGKSKTIG